MPATKKILLLPGRRCRHCVKGRCLYDEHLNQGLYPDHECLVLREWETAYDAFVHRAEAFGLNEGEAGRIWKSRMEALYDQVRNCAQFLPDSEADGFGCRYAEEHLCLKAFPACKGICRHFSCGDSDAC